MSTDRVCVVSFVAALAALGVGCSSSAPGQPTSVVPAVTTVTKLPACTAANKGQVVFLASSGSGTLETCNGTAFVATVCNTSNIDQVLYIVSQATFEACTGSSWTAIPFTPNGVNVGTGPDSIIGTVAGPTGPLSGATVALSGNAASTATTDANGHYAFTGLANGSYGVSVSAGAGCSTASSTLNNISGLREADFTLTATGKAGACASVTGPQGPAGPTGATGPAGSAGAESLVSVRTEPAGANCAAGGQRIDVGIDTNSDGVLATSEIQHTSYVCNGTSGGACAGLPDNTSCASELYGSCQSGACACYQGAAPVTCTSGPSCMNWGFESGTTEGWVADPASLGATNVSISTSHFHSGTRSLAVSLSIAAFSTNDARGASIAVPLCASSGTANLAGSTFSAWVLFTTTNGSLPMNAANLVTGSLVSGAVAVQPANLNTWIQLHGTVSAISATTASLSVEFPIANPNSEGFTGVMYVDDVQISPPTVPLYGSCQSGACACYQGAPPVTCTSGPSCMNWGFESGTTEGWAGDPASLGVTNVSISTSHFHSGTRSLAVSMSIAAFSTNDARGASVAVPLCASTGATNLAGYTFSAWAFFTTTNGSLPMNAANLLTDSLVSSAVAVQQTNLNTWIQLHGSISATSATTASLNVEFPIANPTIEGFTGVMYVDDVQISPP